MPNYLNCICHEDSSIIEYTYLYIFPSRDHFVHAPSQWETSYNVMSSLIGWASSWGDACSTCRPNWTRYLSLSIYSVFDHSVFLFYPICILNTNDITFCLEKWSMVWHIFVYFLYREHVLDPSNCVLWNVVYALCASLTSEGLFHSIFWISFRNVFTFFLLMSQVNFGGAGWVSFTILMVPVIWTRPALIA